MSVDFEGEFVGRETLQNKTIQSKLALVVMDISSTTLDM